MQRHLCLCVRAFEYQLNVSCACGAHFTLRTKTKTHFMLRFRISVAAVLSQGCWSCNPVRVKCQRQASGAANYSTLERRGCRGQQGPGFNLIFNGTWISRSCSKGKKSSWYQPLMIRWHMLLPANVKKDTASTSTSLRALLDLPMCLEEDKYKAAESRS